MNVARPSLLSFVAVPISCALTIFSSGCGQSITMSQPSPTPVASPAGISNPSQFTYVAVPNSSTIEGFKIDPSENVVPIPGSPFAVPEGPVGIARNQQFLFVSSNGAIPETPDKLLISTFRIDQTSGALVKVASLNFSHSFHLAVDPSGKFLYATSPDGIAVFSISDAGQLTEIPGSPFGSPSSLVFAAGPISFHPTGKFLYSFGSSDGPDPTPSAIFASVNASTGAASNGQMLGPETDSLAIAPNGMFMVANDAALGSQNQFCSYNIDQSTGAPSGASLGGVPVTPVSCITVGSTAMQVAIDPTGTLAAVAELPLSNVLLFRIANNTIAPTPSATAPANGDVGLVFSRDGKYLFAAGDGPDNDVTVFRVDVASGTFSPVPGSPFKLTGAPSNIVQ